MGPENGLVGNTVGRLFVLSDRDNICICECDCGEYMLAERSDLLQGRVNDCGCVSSSPYGLRLKTSDR